jgi:hypothetical protein
MGDQSGENDEIVPCYSLKEIEGGEKMLHRIDDLHDEWTVEGLTFDQIKRLVSSHN